MTKEESIEILVSREHLYEMVWSVPTKVIARDFMISDVGLAKICKRLGVPKPPRGYWAKIAAGRKQSRPPLPANNNLQKPGVYVSKRTVPVELIQFSDATMESIRHLTDQENVVRVSETLANPHPLVRKTRDVLLRASPDKYGALSTWNKECLDVRVSKQSLTRCLIIFDALIKRLEQLGFETSISDKRQTLVKKHETNLELCLFERSRRTERDSQSLQKQDIWNYDRFVFEPSGEFEITLRRWPLSERRWRDTDLRKLEDRMTDIVLEIVYSIELVQIEMKRREIEQQRRQQLEKEIEEERKRESAEIQRRVQLESQAENWRRANQIRQFVNAYHMNCIDRGIMIDADSPKFEWLKWANEHADRIDPLVSGSVDLVIGNSDKSSVSEPN